ncbi:chorismate mutase [Tabrizicola oligotrophica]|uniref:chorismate mutase n=1 Tax=Tabrizicola oligotrophica TaxID=2710650 RepID=A0A6M0QU35_9RHOB|nr:chorismate mutase [Tabrizicola oligotrophica]NEY91008.1 chorismate mutase [Tabrizicola oligotrophica]
MKAPQDCHDMTELRAAIDALDAGIVAQLKARAGYIDRAVELKQGIGLPARIDERVEEVVASVRAEAAAQALDPDLVEDLWRRLIDWSIAREERILGAARP